MRVLSAGRCDWYRDEQLSEERGTPEKPNVFRCRRCGIVLKPVACDDPRRIRGRECRWFDPKVPAFMIADPCWCNGLGDVVAWLIWYATRWLPWQSRVLDASGRLVDRLEKLLTGRAYKQVVGESKCQGCGVRRQSLNTRFPLLWLRRRICSPIVVAKEERGDPIPVCLTFPHGFGDAVQFTAVLRHLQKYRPNWRMSIYCKAGAHTLYRGYVDRVGVMDRENLGKVYREDYAQVYGIRWSEPEETFRDSPSTKVERCLREEFGITPDPQLWNYKVHSAFNDDSRAWDALSEIAKMDHDGRFPVVGIHYQGNSFRESKNLDEGLIYPLVDQLRKARMVPLIFDFEKPHRSELLRQNVRGVRCFDIDHWLWRGLGTGDGSQMLSLIDKLRLFIGIDSGPEHLAAATQTPTIVVWGRGTHPVNYFSPARNVTHVVRCDQAKYIRGDWEIGDAYFRANYRFHELKTNVRVALPDIVQTELENAVRTGTARGVLG